MIRITAECSNTIARFMIEEANVSGRTLSLIASGLTLRDMAKLKLATRSQLEGLSPSESLDVSVSAESVRAFVEALRSKKATLVPNVNVQFWSAGEVPHGLDADIGVAHAKLGYPVAVRIARGNNAHSLHLSLAEVRALVEQFAPLVKLEDDAGA